MRTVSITRSISVASILALLLTCIPAPTVKALSGGEFRAGRIIDDAFFTDTNGISVDNIQALLNDVLASSDATRDGVSGSCDTNGSKTVFDNTTNSTVSRATYASRRSNPTTFTCLKDYYENPDTKASNYGGQPVPAGAKSAAQLIYDAGKAYNINPKVLLVTLQKEQALLTDDWPFQRQFSYAMGAHCPDSGPSNSANCDAAYSGFGVQMKEAARLFRYYLDNMNQPWWSYKKPGNNQILYNPSTACGSSQVQLESSATAALYTYTPYQPNPAALGNLYGTGDSCSAYGNRNFWRMYNSWFGSSIGCPTLENGPVYRIHRVSDNNYMFTNNTAEICFAVLYYGYAIDGPAMTPVAADSTDARSMYRLSRNGSFLFTTDPNEMMTALNTYGYRYEGVPFYVRGTPATNYYPVYRLSRNSHYVMTVSEQERNSYTASGYSYEGTVFYAQSPSSRVSVFRLSRGGLHLYTSSPSERDAAISSDGYSYEGVAFYAQSGMTGDTTTVYRLERKNRYLNTMSYNEKLAAVVSNYRQENASFYAYPPNYPGTVLVFRLVNKSNGDYLLTTNTTERDQAIASYGYTYEGLAFNASPNP